MATKRKKKVCLDCGIADPVMFGVNARNPDGRQNRCYSCTNQRQKQWKLRHDLEKVAAKRAKKKPKAEPSVNFTMDVPIQVTSIELNGQSERVKAFMTDLLGVTQDQVVHRAIELGMRALEAQPLLLIRESV